MMARSARAEIKAKIDEVNQALEEEFLEPGTWERGWNLGYRAGLESGLEELDREED